MPLTELEVRDASLRRWARQFTDTTPIASAEPRQPAVCVGVVHKIRLDPGRALEVTIEDGSGHLTGVWTCRPNLAGLQLGAALRLEGCVAEVDGERVMRNPQWTPVIELYAETPELAKH